MEIKVHRNEEILFVIKATVTVIITWLVITFLTKMSGSTDKMMFLTFVFYFVFIGLFFYIQKILLVAYVKGNGICVSEKQFPDVFNEYRLMADKLDLPQVPGLFIIQQGGMLNAFAVRFSGSNYIAVYSDIFALMSSDPEVLKFVIGHELGHVKRSHMSKRFWTFPSSVVPFLTPAYSRACEYTCDNIGAALVKEKFIDGLVLLAAGKELYKKVDIGNYLTEAARHNTLAVKFASLFMSHPYLPKRVRNIGYLAATPSDHGYSAF